MVFGSGGMFISILTKGIGEECQHSKSIVLTAHGQHLGPKVLGYKGRNIRALADSPAVWYIYVIKVVMIYY